MKEKQTAPTDRQTVSTLLAQAIIGLQRKWTAFMTKRTLHWQRKQKMAFLIAICLLLGGSSILTLVQTFLGKPHQTISPTAPLPQMIIPEQQRPLPEGITDAEAKILSDFHHSVDSLRQTAEGRRKLEGFEKAHPGFIDSLLSAEKMIMPTF